MRVIGGPFRNVPVLAPIALSDLQPSEDHVPLSECSAFYVTRPDSSEVAVEEE